MEAFVNSDIFPIVVAIALFNLGMLTMWIINKFRK